jgi:hypothetical protein
MSEAISIDVRPLSRNVSMGEGEKSRQECKVNANIIRCISIYVIVSDYDGNNIILNIS